MVGHLFYPQKGIARASAETVKEVTKVPQRVLTGDFSKTTDFESGVGYNMLPVGISKDEYTTLYKASKGALTKSWQDDYSKLLNARAKFDEDTSSEGYKITESDAEKERLLDEKIGRYEAITYDVSKSREHYRNELAWRLIAVSDRMSEEHITGVMATSATTNFGLGSLTNLLATSSTLFGANSTKSILSSGAAFSNSTRSLFNEEIFRNAFSDAIVTEMKKIRAKEWNAIKDNFKKSIIDYPTDRMLMDINKYHYSGSFAEGLTAVVSKATREKSVHDVASEIDSLDSIRKSYEDAGNQEAADIIKARMTKIAEAYDASSE